MPAELHDPRLASPANDVEPVSGPERSLRGPERASGAPGNSPGKGGRILSTRAPDWRLRSALTIADVLHARGLTGGNAARWWRVSDRTARKVLVGDKPLSIEKLLALPEGACLDALDALARLKRAA